MIEDSGNSRLESIGLADELSYDFGGADARIRLDFGKIRALILQVCNDFVEIYDIAVYDDGKNAVTRREHHRLDVVADHADAVSAVHLRIVLLKLWSEILAANVMDLALDPLFSKNRHAGVIRAQVAVIIDAVVE